MNLHFLTQNQKNKILKQLKLQFGITKIPFNLIKVGKERIVALSENIDGKQIEKIQNVSIIEGIGVYFSKEMNNEIRLSIEGTHLFKDQILKNIFELNAEQAQQWMSGNEIQVKTNKNTFLVMKYKDDFLGTGKASENKITNFIPKARRLKIKD